MSNKRLAEKKKRKRIEEKRQKALKVAAQAIEDRKEKNKEFFEEKERMGKMAPIRKNSTAGASEIFDKLTHNIEILRALEEEFDVAQEEKIRRNQELEAQGFTDLESKMNHLHGKVLSEQTSEGLSFGGEAEVTFTPNVILENSNESQADQGAILDSPDYL